MENMTGEKLDRRFVEEILDGMYDWVRVLDRDDNLIYVNKAMTEALGEYPVGKKCYESLGRTTPCDNCVSRKAVFDGLPHEKEEIFGDRIFSVMSSPVKNHKGEVVYVVEVLRDVTRVRKMHERILLQNKKHQENLEIAGKIQLNLLPRAVSNSRYDYFYVFSPCEQLGGDFTDFFTIGDHKLGIYIADVQGHGVPASLLTVFLKSTLNKEIESPAEALSSLYEEYNRQNFDPHLYITMFYGIVDLKSHTLVYSNAGHSVSPILYGRNKFKILRAPGIPISNWMPHPEYSDIRTDFNPGERLFMYTDGLLEARNCEDKQFGEERVIDLLLESNLPVSLTLERIMQSVTSHICSRTGRRNLCDDITAAMLELK